jgi:hypothetical protein
LSQERLSKLLEAAKILKIKGLWEADGSGDKDNDEEKDEEEDEEESEDSKSESRYIARDKILTTLQLRACS